MTLSQIRSEALKGTHACCVHAQVEEVHRKDSSNGKPYFELKLRDATDALTLRAWSDSAAFDACGTLAVRSAVEVEGEFFMNGSFGLDARRWKVRVLSAEEAEALFAGDEATRQAQKEQIDEIAAMVASIQDPRLSGLCELFFRDFGARFMRTAAARLLHHAWRGGLLAHTLQMMRSASAICDVYPSLNRDLMLTGVLFHDTGKLWETCPPEAGFEITRELRGEMLGHISIGIELVNTLWRGLPLDSWKSLIPASEDVRLHLLHLIASHHGELEFGSPVQPKTAEAIALHYIDNLDARLEMLRMAMLTQPEVAPGILERVRPLGVNPIRSLQVCPPSNEPPPDDI